MKTIVVCTSAAFYEHANQAADELTKLGYKVVVPATAVQMRQAGNYDVGRVKTWFDDPNQAHIKQGKAIKHFEEIQNGDAVLIINDDKPGKPNYIGPNTMMEWGVAYYLGKPVFLLNALAKDHNSYEEALSMTTQILDGDLAKIKL